jgi:DNA-binding transcriptional LysR family regulator
MASDYVQAVFFPALMERTLAAAPLSSIRAILPDLGRFHRDLENGRLDVAFGYFTDLGPTLRSVGLFHDRLVCVLPKARSASKRPFRLKDYLALNHVVFFREENGSSTMERHTFPRGPAIDRGRKWPISTCTEAREAATGCRSWQTTTDR